MQRKNNYEGMVNDMPKRYEIVEFSEMTEATDKYITKFGGQPDWISEPEWPQSNGWDNLPMMFIGQILIKEGSLSNNCECMIYLFVTHPGSCNDPFFDPDVQLWNGGENAVIIQPFGNKDCSVKTKKERKGPTLFNSLDKQVTLKPTLKMVDEPEFVKQEDYIKMNEEEQKFYYKSIDVNKFGGVPSFFRRDEWPGEDWFLLLQLRCETLPFVLRVGSAAVMFVFVSSDLTRGRIIIQD